MKMKIVFALIILFSTAILSVNAQTIRGKARHQKHRIAEGVKSGELTRGETRRLVKEQREIHQNIRNAKSDDGRIDRAERAGIRRDQRAANRHIFWAKHNNRDRN